MKKREVVFFAGPFLEHVQPIKANLSAHYTCIQSSTPDEYNQTFHQSGKFVLIFGDAQEGARLLARGASELVGIEFKACAYLHKDARFKPESQKILDSMRISVFMKSQAEALIADVNNYFKGGAGFSAEDIEFNVPKE